MNKWINFYEQFFIDHAAAKIFVDSVEFIDDPEITKHRAKIMMHQVQRLVSLADDLIEIRKGKESISLLFLLICAENVAKLFHDFKSEGESRKYVRKFFDEFVIGNDRKILEDSFSTHEITAISLQAIVDGLYVVRCDVVHEGRYWDFHFGDVNDATLNLDPDFVVKISLKNLRDIVVRGCIHAIKTIIDKE